MHLNAEFGTHISICSCESHFETKLCQFALKTDLKLDKCFFVKFEGDAFQTGIFLLHCNETYARSTIIQVG